MALQRYNLVRIPSPETPHFLAVEASTRIPTRCPNSSKLLPFSSSFTFSIAPRNNSPPGHGFASCLLWVLKVPLHNGILVSGTAPMMVSPNNHVFGIDFQNQEFNDINDEHVMNAHSLLWLPRKPGIGLMQRTIKARLIGLSKS